MKGLVGFVDDGMIFDSPTDLRISGACPPPAPYIKMYKIKLLVLQCGIEGCGMCDLSVVCVDCSSFEGCQCLFDTTGLIQCILNGKNRRKVHHKRRTDGQNNNYGFISDLFEIFKQYYLNIYRIDQIIFVPYGVYCYLDIMHLGYCQA